MQGNAFQSQNGVHEQFVVPTTRLCRIAMLVRGCFASSWRVLLILLPGFVVDAAAHESTPSRDLIAPPAWLPRYELDIRLDLVGLKAFVHQRVTWNNRHARQANEIVFNAHSHYRPAKKEIGLLAKTAEMLRNNPGECLYRETPLQMHTICLGGRSLAFRYQGDTATDLVVSLPTPVGPGESVILDMEFTFILPQKQGRWGQWQGVTFLSNWLPVVAVYNDRGWQPTPFIAWHQPFFNEAGVYHARLTLPADQKVATSGTIQAVRQLDKGWQQLDIEALGIRELTFLCSARYVEFSGEAATLPEKPPVRVHILAFPEHEHYARVMLKTILEVIPCYSQWIGRYPWADYTIAEAYFGWNGNECSTLVMIDERVFAMPHVGEGYVEYLIAHETCHQWWYNLIGTNGYCETWMDEAMATFWAHRFLDRKHGCNNKMFVYPHGLEWLPNVHRDNYRYSGLAGAVGRGELTATVQEMPAFGNVATLFNMCYDKGGTIVGMIQDRLGETAFIDFIHRIYERYAYRIVRVADFQHELEEYTGRSWEDFFQRWLYGAGLCDWAVEQVEIEPLDTGHHSHWGDSFLEALHQDVSGRPCRVTVLLQQRAQYDEETVLGFCLEDDGTSERTPYQVRVPILPQAPLIEHTDLPARVEVLPNHRVRVQITLPCRPLQIAVDPDNVLVDTDRSNNLWKRPIRWRFAPVYTFLEETDLTTAYDRWNVILGPWLNGATWSDPWYTRSSVIGARAGLYRTQEFSGGIYAGYRPSFQDVVAGVDGVWSHFPWPHAEVGFNGEVRLATIESGDAHPSRAVLYGRYIFQYNSSLYLPPIHYVEAFTTAQENLLPYPAHSLAGAQRYDNLEAVGLHYHLNTQTPYWNPEGGFQFDLTCNGGVIAVDRHVGMAQLVGQFATVRALPDLADKVDQGTWPGKVLVPVLHWLGDTSVAVRAYGAGGLPNRVEFFNLGGDTLFRGFDLRQREGSLVWVGSLEWRLPLIRHVTCDFIDHVVSVRHLYAAGFYDVGDAYVRGHSYGPVAHAVGAGLRLDVTWCGFLDRSTLRFDVAKAVNCDTPVEVWFGLNLPF